MPTKSSQSSLRVAFGKPYRGWLRALGVLWLVAYGPWACQATPKPPLAEEVPAREFILETLEFEERREGLLVWQGHAARGAGDLTLSDVDDLTLTRTPQEPGDIPLHICAAHAHLALAQGQAHFEPVLACDDSGRRLQGLAADYSEADKTLRAQGPIRMTAPGARIDAASAILHIEAGRLLLEGPVTGHFDPAHTGP